MADRRLRIAVPAVTHERLDDEVIAINLDTGIYYALVGPAADVWSSFDPPASVVNVAETLARRYRVEAERMTADVEAFARRLEDAGLLVADADDRRAPPSPLPPLPPGAEWMIPELEEYRDMADLVLLDPIHQVDESGWPHLPDSRV